MQLPLFQETHEPDFEALARCLKAQVVAVDVETETRWQGSGPRVDFGLSYPADVTVIAFAWLEGREIRTTALAAPFPAMLHEYLRALFHHARPVVAHNAVFDMRQLSRLTDGMVAEQIWDTQTMARLIHPAVNASYSLLAVAAMLGLSVQERQQTMKSQRAKLHRLPLDLTVQYAQDDARLALEIYQKQKALPCDPELLDWECRAVHEYCRMAAQGVRLNIPFVEARLAQLGEQRTLLTANLRADGLLTPGSPKARAEYLYVTKGIPMPKWHPRSGYFTRGGRRRLIANPNAPVELSDLSTRADVIESYMEEGSPFLEPLKDLAAYLDVDWLISTLEGLLDHAVVDGRLHSLVTIATESGRRASSYPHMQNWKMPAMAGVAIGDERCTLVEIDYRNAENVMAALISGDSTLAAACDTDDFHAAMAVQYFGNMWESADAQERKRLRTMSKKITYGTSYGMGAERLGESIGVSRAEAWRLIQAKDRAFAKVTEMRNAAQRQVEQTHMLHLWTGRPVAVPTPFVAWNYLCQGGVGEMVKRAIIVTSESFRAAGMRSRVALDMHDAIIFEIAHDEWDAALEMASHIMSHTVDSLVGRTDPPIRPVAIPDLHENQRKWGAEQWHPENRL